MNREQIARRIDLIGPSTGAIVSVATWCALHGAEAESIMAYIVEKMKHKETSDAQRASLIYLIHELLLTCATRGVSDSAKRSILIAVSRMLPRAVQDALRQKSSDHTVFVVALQKATEWWAMLNLFPTAWLSQLQRSSQAAQEAVSHHTAVPAALLQVATLMQRYQHAKEIWLQNKHIKAEEGVSTTTTTTAGSGTGVNGQDDSGGNGGGASASSAVVDDAAHRCLVALRKAVESRFERNAALLAWCEAERAELEGHVVAHAGGGAAAGLVKTEPSTTAASHGGANAAVSVKEEAGVTGGHVAGGRSDDDDVLGSFFS